MDLTGYLISLAGFVALVTLSQIIAKLLKRAKKPECPECRTTEIVQDEVGESHARYECSRCRNSWLEVACRRCNAISAVVQVGWNAYDDPSTGKPIDVKTTYYACRRCGESWRKDHCPRCDETEITSETHSREVHRPDWRPGTETITIYKCRECGKLWTTSTFKWAPC